MDHYSRNNTQVFLTVDVEDYRYFRRRNLGLPVRSGAYYVELGVERILKFLDSLPSEIKITFFTTATLARDQKALVRNLKKLGHEIASHSFEHERLDLLPLYRARSVLTKSKETIEDAIGDRVYGFRAPSFALPDCKESFFKILAESGYVYDSSELQRSTRIEKHFKGDLHTVQGNDLIEFPLCQLKMPWFSLRIIGGTYFRFLPMNTISKFINYSRNRGFCPVIWLHPVDFCNDFVPYQFSEILKHSLIKSLSWPLEIFTLKAGVNSVIPKLKFIAQKHGFLGTMSEEAFKILDKAAVENLKLTENL